MGMSMRAVGLTSEAEPTYQKYAAVLRACLAAGIAKLPSEAASYFGSEYVEEYLLSERREIKLALNEWQTDAAEGFDLRVADIPAGVDIIRFSCSW